MLFSTRPFLKFLFCFAIAMQALGQASPRHPEAPSQSRALRISILKFDAVGDGTQLATDAIQKTIDHVATSGGGTVVIPQGVFLSGALFLKPGVNLHLEKDAVIKCSTDMTNFPPRSTRIEGHFPTFTPALLNAVGCDGLRITGEGTLDGAGRPIWDEFWARLKADRTTKNLDVARARLAFISNSRDVRVEGVTFKDSQFWNLHLYHCQNVVVQNARFIVPDNYKQAPSTDGIDVDSSQDVLIQGCYFSVTDDCIAMKGTKGPFALEDKLSPPVERVRVVDCVFRRGHAAITLGSEATIVRDIVAENNRITGPMHMLNVKLRPDTPQCYENIRLSDFVLDSQAGRLIFMNPWRQYFDLKGQPPPSSTVRGIELSRVTGRYGSLGNIEGNSGQTEISGILFKDIDLKLTNDQLKTVGAQDVRMENVTINGITR